MRPKITLIGAVFGGGMLAASRAVMMAGGRVRGWKVRWRGCLTWHVEFFLQKRGDQY